MVALCLILLTLFCFSSSYDDALINIKDRIKWGDENYHMVFTKPFRIGITVSDWYSNEEFREILEELAESGLLYRTDRIIWGIEGGYRV